MPVISYFPISLPPEARAGALLDITADAGAAEPSIELEGMAETGEGNAVVRTAILSVGGELVLATLGTEIAGRYRVSSLSATAVELVHLSDGPSLVLRLR
jgi:hypothetical protein